MLIDLFSLITKQYELSIFQNELASENPNGSQRTLLKIVNPIESVIAAAAVNSDTNIFY